jgi:hypothetical protein
MGTGRQAQGGLVDSLIATLLGELDLLPVEVWVADHETAEFVSGSCFHIARHIDMNGVIAQPRTAICISRHPTLKRIAIYPRARKSA